MSGCVFLAGCTGLDSVEPAERNTWMYFYGGLGNYTGVTAEPLDDGGFLLVGDSVSSSNYGITVIRTDRHGKELWRNNIPRGSASGLKVTQDGYFIIGSGIYVNLTEPVAALQVRHVMRLLKINPNGGIDRDVLSGDTSVANYNGNAVTVNGNFLYTVSDEKRFVPTNSNLIANVSTYDLSTLNLIKSNPYDLDDRDYVNTNSIYYTADGNLAWAMSAEFSNANSVRSAIRLPVLASNTFVNGDNYGNTDQNFQVADFQPGGASFGIIGTYATITNTKSNVFFVRTISNANLTFQTSDIKFFDGGDPTDPDDSRVEDSGLAISGTQDGGFLLGCSTTKTQTGKDILLIRVDFTGKTLWKKTIGGTGDEILSSIRATSDGGYIMSGTLDLAGLKSMFLLKVNADGDLKD